MGNIKVGEDAPLFKLTSYNKGLVDLEKLIGSQKIVLIFSRYFGCPLCQMDWKVLLERQDEIKNKGAPILYITQSGEKVVKKFIEEGNVDFPVIFSPKEELYTQYNLGMMGIKTIAKVPKRLKEAKKLGIEHGEYEGYEKQEPGQFVIDENGKIIHAKKGWMDIDAILEVL
ncbi:MAG: redoxin domain-containing protein [Promethearchaeota archaeon]